MASDFGALLACRLLAGALSGLSEPLQRSPRESVQRVQQPRWQGAGPRKESPWEIVGISEPLVLRALELSGPSRGLEQPH